MATKSSGKKSSQSQSARPSDFPLDNNTYNVITVIHEKSKGLEAFDQYIEDADEELREIFQEIRDQDTRYIEQLQEQLRLLIASDEGAESEEEEAA